jgi:hypothetical protein
MLIREFVDSQQVADKEKLLAIATFLSNRADDTNAQKQISTNAFIDLAKSLKVNVTPENIGDIISQDPLQNVLEPYEPNSGVIRFKGDTETQTGMTVDQARAVVDANAKQALKRRM